MEEKPKKLTLKGCLLEFKGCLAIIIGFFVLMVIIGVLAGSDNSKDSKKPVVDKLAQSQQAYQDGIKSLNDKKYAWAVTWLKQVIKEDKNFNDAQAKLQKAKLAFGNQLLFDGKNKMNTGEYSAALNCFTQAFELNPNLTEAKTLKEQAQIKYNAQTRETLKENMSIYEGDGKVKIAVVEVKLKQSTGDHVAGKNGTFVYTLVSAKNFGNSIIHVNPNDFTLSAPDGETVSHDTDTYTLSNYLDAVDLRPGNSTSGWLIFYTTKTSNYTLNYQGFYGTATKSIFI